MAAQWLAKFGAEAFKPQRINGNWRKALVSPLSAARLRKQYLLEGREWPYEKPLTDHKPVKCKGHKHDKAKVERLAEIQRNLAGMEQRVAAYRASKRQRDVPLIDRLLLTPKEQREKAKK